MIVRLRVTMFLFQWVLESVRVYSYEPPEGCTDDSLAEAEGWIAAIAIG